MSLLEAIRGANLRSSHIKHDASAPVLQGKFDSISKEYDASVLRCNLEHWAHLLGDLTYNTLFVALTPDDARQLLGAYEDTERRPDAVESAATDYLLNSQKDLPPLNSQEAALRVSLGPSIQSAIERLSQPSGEASEKGCFVKLSSRSPKDAAARSGIFKAFYKDAIMRHPEALSDPNAKLKILCEAERLGLKFSSATDVVRALILSERVWQDLVLALRHPESWQQNIIIRSWEHVEIDMEFRMFVFQNKLTAISQYAYQLHSPHLLKLRSEVLDLLHNFYETRLRPKLCTNGFDKCVIDAAVMSSDGKLRCKVIEINPFLPTTDGALFSWETERDLLEGDRTELCYPILRLTEKPRVGALVMVPQAWKIVMEEVEKNTGE